MRTKALVLMAALLAAFSTAAGAQGPATDNAQSTAAPAATPAAPAKPSGRIELGLRGTDLTGDPARFQRYRDLGDGGFLEGFRWNYEDAKAAFSAGADHVGRTDQRYWADFLKIGKARASFTWDQTPLFISGDTSSIFAQESAGIFRVSDDIQGGIQNQTLTIQQAYAASAVGFETKNRRDTARFDATFTAARDVDFKMNFVTAKREGNMPLGASFGFSHVVELPAPIDTRTTDFGLDAEWANQKGMLKVGYLGSWFTNEVQTLVWDNPLKLTDSTFAGAYVAGLGTSQGRMPLWPDNTSHTVSATAAYKLPARSRVTGYLAIGSLTSDAAIVPHTINTAIADIPLERTRTEGDARTVAANFAFTSRPNRHVGLNARYRYYDYDNRTPHFATPNYVRFDQVWEPEGWESEPLGVKRHTFDADVTFTPIPLVGIQLGYGRLQSDRTFRIFEKTVDDAFRASVDLTGNQFFSVRALYERSVREGDGFELHLLEEVGEQPDMRHFDVANRNRDRVTMLVSVTPIPELGLNASIAAGKDDYKDSGFGLRDNDNRVYSVGFDVVPNERVAFGLSYNYENYTALQNSRNAAPGAQFTDPLRNWSIDSDDTAHSVLFNFEVLKAIPNTDIRFGYDYSKSEATYVYGLVPGSTLAAPQQLPPVLNTLHRGTIDATYFFTKRVGLGLGYWYDKYDVDDFALGDTLITGPVSLPTGILLGYTYRPFTAHTGSVRLVVGW